MAWGSVPLPSGVPSMCFLALEINCPGTPDFSTGHRTPRFFLTHPGWCTTFGIPEGAAWREAVDAVDVGRSNLEIVTLCHPYVIIMSSCYIALMGYHGILPVSISISRINIGDIRYGHQTQGRISHHVWLIVPCLRCLRLEGISGIFGRPSFLRCWKTLALQKDRCAWWWHDARPPVQPTEKILAVNLGPRHKSIPKDRNERCFQSAIDDVFPIFSNNMFYLFWGCYKWNS